MHPPAHILQKLQELHPHVRLGWYGIDRIGPTDEMNKGFFALLQLYRNRDAEAAYYDTWNDRGPVFGKHYDRLLWQPMFLYQLTKEQVFSGDIIGMVIKWMKPIKERLLSSAYRKGDAYQSQAANVTGEVGEKLWWAANKADTPIGKIIAKKFISAEDKAIAAGDRKIDLRNVFVPPGLR